LRIPPCSKLSLLAVALTLGAHAAQAQASVTPEDRRFEAMVRAADKQDLAADPTRRTVQTLTPSEAQWTPVSDAWRAAKTKVAAQRLAALPKAIDRKTLSPDHQILFDLYAANLTDAGITQKALLNGYTSGANIFDAAWDLPQTLERSQKLGNVQDARNYLARLNGLPQVLDDTLAAGETRRARDIVLTMAGYKALAIQVREFAKGAPCAGAGEHALAHDFKAKLAASTVAQADRPALIAAADAALKDRVCPAYAKFADAVEAMAPSGRDGGMWERVGGAERYRDFVEFHLADRVDPEVLYDTGVKAVAELETELRTEAGKLGLHGDIAAIRKALDEDPKLSVPNTPEGYSQIEAITNARLADVEKRLPAWFSYIPKTPVVVQRALEGPPRWPAQRRLILRRSRARRLAPGSLQPGLPARSGAHPGLVGGDGHLSRGHSRPRLPGQLHQRIARRPGPGPAPVPGGLCRRLGDVHRAAGRRDGRLRQ
jgi:uncharacterized protein (DUF885 family)